MKTLLVLAITFAGNLASAAPSFYVEGVLVSYDKTKVKLRQDDGHSVYVHRKDVPNIDGYVVGKARIEVLVYASDLLKLNPRLAAKLGRSPSSVTK